MNVDLGRCTICLENFQSDREKKIAHSPKPNGALPHFFHEFCLNDWALVNPECPICKRAISPGIRSLRIVHLAIQAGLIHEEVQVVRAAQKGNIFSIARALYSGHIDQQTRGFAVRCAVKERNLITLALLIKTGTINQLDRGLAVKSAANQDFPLILSILLNSGPISDEHRGLAFRKAVDAQSFIMAKMLLESGSVSEDDIYAAIISSASNENPAMFKFFLKKPLSPHLRGAALISLVKDGDFLYAQDLLESGDITKECREEAVVVASTYGHSILVDCLLSNERIRDEFVDEALQAASTGDFLRISLALILHRHLGLEDEAFGEIETLVQTENPDSVQLGRGVCWLSERGHYRLVELLLQRGSISIKYRGIALWSAAKFGSFRLVQLLKLNREVEEKFIKFSIIESAKTGNVDSLSFLLNFVSTKSLDIDYAIWHATKGGHLKIVDLLLKLTTFKGMFLEWSIEDAFSQHNFLIAVAIISHLINKNKAISDDIESIELYLQDNIVGPMEMKRAFIYAIKAGSLELFKLLKKFQTISQEEKKFLKLFALESDQKDIVDFLNIAS